MNCLTNFSFRKNKIFFKKTKKNILLIVKKSPNEIDWILPLLHNAKKKYNIITIFKENSLYERLKNNKKLFSLWENLSCYYTFHPTFRCFGLRILTKFFNKLNLKNNLNTTLNKTYYDFNNFQNCFKKETKLIDFKLEFNSLFIGIHNQSYWPEIIKKNNPKVKIFAFPEQISFSENKIRKKIKIDQSKNIILVHSKKHLRSLKRIFIIQKYKLVYYPKYTRKWLNIIIKKNKTNKNQILIVFKGYDRNINIKSKYKDQIIELLNFAKKHKLKLLFNVHPYTKKHYLKNIIYSHQYKFTKFSKNSLLQDIHDSGCVLNIYSSNTILDCIALKKIPYELWNIKKNDFSVYKNKYSYHLKNAVLLKDILDKKKASKFKFNDFFGKKNFINLF